MADLILISLAVFGIFVMVPLAPFFWMCCDWRRKQRRRVQWSLKMMFVVTIAISMLTGMMLMQPAAWGLFSVLVATGLIVSFIALVYLTVTDLKWKSIGEHAAKHSQTPPLAIRIPTDAEVAAANAASNPRPKKPRWDFRVKVFNPRSKKLM